MLKGIKTFHIHNMKELILSKCQCYSKQSIDSVNSYQSANDILHKISILIFMGIHKRLQIDKHFEWKKQRWGHQHAWFQNILQNNQNCTVLAYRQTYRPMEQSGPYKYVHVYIQLILENVTKIHWERTAFSTCLENMILKCRILD